MAAPGKYQVRFTVDGTAHTQPFEVIKDPAIAVVGRGPADSRRATQMRIRDDLTQTSEMVNQMEMLAEADRGPGQGQRRRSRRS